MFEIKVASGKDCWFDYFKQQKNPGGLQRGPEVAVKESKRNKSPPHPEDGGSEADFCDGIQALPSTDVCYFS